MRAAQLRALAPALVRAVRWQAVPVVAVGAALLMWWRADRIADLGYAIWTLRVIALLLAVAVTFALDDPTGPTLAAVPTPRWWRILVRLLVVGVPAVVVWAAALVLVEQRVAVRLPVTALCLEAATLYAVALGLAGGLARWRDIAEPGVVASPALLALGLVLPQLPSWTALVVNPGPAWSAAHLRWLVLLAGGAAVLAGSMRDPGARWRRPDRA